MTSICDGPLDQPGAAGAADAALARERQVGAHPERGLEHGYVVGAQVEVGPAAVEPDGDARRRPRRRPRARRRAPAARGRRGTARCGPGRAPRSVSTAAQLVDHLLRAAQEPVVDLGGRDQRVEDPAQPVAVEPPGQQLDVLRLTRQHVHDLEPLGEAVLEVVHLVEEHHRPAGPVGVDERHERAGLALEDRRDDREHRRDARAGRDRDVRLGRASGRGVVVNRPAGVITSSSSPDPERVDDALAERAARAAASRRSGARRWRAGCRSSSCGVRRRRRGC